MRRQKKKNWLFAAGALALAALTLAPAAGGSVRAEEGSDRAVKIQSKGIINYAGGSVVIDTGDLTFLAGEIDKLEQNYKTELLQALNGIGTYLREDGSVTHRDGTLTSQPLLPTFLVLKSAIAASQSSEVGIADLSDDSYFRAKDGGLIRTSSGQDTSGAEAIALAAVTPDKMSAGTVAYVDGHLLLGTGADCKAHYNAGYAEGYAQAAEGSSVEYTYHVHTGEVGLDVIPNGYVWYSTADPGGCFTEAGHSHNSGGIQCDTTTQKQPCRCTGWHASSSGGGCSHCGHTEGSHSGGSCHSTSNVTVYTCGSPTNVWQLGCGKTTETIVSATVVFP